MKKAITCILTLSVICSLFTSSMAAEEKIAESESLARIEHYAYMDLSTADESVKSQIIDARNYIIFNNSWVADDINGRVRDSEGNIVEVLPHFSELFPADWELPIYPTNGIEASDINIAPLAANGWDTVFHKPLKLSYPSSSNNTPPFYTLTTHGFPNTSSEYYIRTINTLGMTNLKATYNVGYANATTGKSLGHKDSIQSGFSFEIDPPYDIKVAIRASTYSAVSDWDILVTTYRISGTP